MKRSVLLLLLSLLWDLPGAAAEEAWRRSYSDPVGLRHSSSWATVEWVADPQGGFFDVCTLDGLLIRRFDAHGNLLWLRKYAGSVYYESLAPLPDGSFLAFAYNNTIGGPVDWGFRCNAQGEVEKEWVFGEFGIYRTFSLDASAVVAVGPDSGWFTALDPATGRILWSRTLYSRAVPVSFNYPTVTAKATPDGGFIFLGQLEGGYHGDRVHGTLLFKMSHEGHLQWAKAYDFLDFCESDGGGNGCPQDARKLEILPDGGIVIGSSHTGWGDASPNRTTVLCLNADGSIRWQKYTRTDPSCSGGLHLYQQGLIAQGFDGNILLSGTYVSCNPYNWFPCILVLSPEDGHIVKRICYGGSIREVGQVAVAPKEGGFIGFYDYASADLQYYARYDSDFGLPMECDSNDILPVSFSWEDDSFTALDMNDVLEEDNPYAWSADVKTHEQEDWTESQRSEMICGDAFPGIQSVKVLHDPFRLKVVGWNFQEGAEVRVNGVAVPRTRYRGTDKNNRTRLVASGAGLKDLLPKGEAVALTVVNPDGKESAAFSFAR
ncbi:MAG: hypothetical protein ACOYXN_03900 [Acidobacteriota bacterium]